MLFFFVAAVLGAFALVWIAAPVGALWLHHEQRYDEEIAWLEQMQPLLPMGAAFDPTIERLQQENIRRELFAGRVDRAVVAVRGARARARRTGRPLDAQTAALGLETYTRAADRMQQHGKLSLAADWNDTLFAFAVRDPDPDHRNAAVAAFVEGLDLRVRDGQPCAALARYQWAQRGLGGEVPQLGPEVEQRLTQLCTDSHGGASR
jgi:hypothetical protein